MGRHRRLWEEVPRRIVQALVILTFLLCLAVSAYSLQAWWARKLASGDDEWPGHAEQYRGTFYVSNVLAMPIGDFLQEWRTCPW